jgi:hypothetical protein
MKTKSDPVLKDYFSRLERLCDILNLIFYDGKPFIDKRYCRLVSADSSKVSHIKDNVISMQRYRDVFVEYSQNEMKEYYGLENQTSIDYTMPTRSFIYDAHNIIGQYANYSREYRKALKEKRKLPKFKLNRVRTAVIYYGKEGVDERYSQLSTNLAIYETGDNNWRTPFVSLIDLDSANCKNKDNRDLITLMKLLYEGINKGELEKLERMEVSIDVAIVAATLTKDERLLEIVKENEKEGEVEMCESLRLFRQSGIDEGIHKQEIKMLIDLLTSKFGEISEKLKEMIRNGNEKNLHELTINIFNVENEEDVIKILIKK